MAHPNTRRPHADGPPSPGRIPSRTSCGRISSRSSGSRRFYRDRIGALVATWGVSLILSQGTLLVFGPSMDSVPLPTWTFAYGGYSFGGYRLLLFAIALAVVAAAWWFLYRTRLGVRTRATMQNAEVGRALGVDTGRVYFYTFGAGAGLTGALYAPMGLGLGLLWGYGGVLSFGQAAFFGIAGYVYGIIAGNLTDSGAGTLLAALGGVAAAVAAAFGYFVFYGQVSAWIIPLLTLVLSLILETFMAQTAGYQWRVGSVLLGGYNGMTGIPSLQVAGVDFGGATAAFYLLVVVLMLVTYLGLRLFVNSHTGHVVLGIRDDPERTRLLGYDVSLIQVAVFTLAAALAGLSGVLYVSWGNYMSPSARDSFIGILHARTGEVRLAGKPITRLAADRRAALGIGYVPQGREIFPELTVEENLMMGETINRAKDRPALTVLLVEQNTYLIAQVADRGYAMDKGRIVAALTGDDLRDRERLVRYLAV